MGGSVASAGLRKLRCKRLGKGVEVGGQAPLVTKHRAVNEESYWQELTKEPDVWVLRKAGPPLWEEH